jgi:hypothetical protein
MLLEATIAPLSCRDNRTMERETSYAVYTKISMGHFPNHRKFSPYREKKTVNISILVQFAQNTTTILLAHYPYSFHYGDAILEKEKNSDHSACDSAFIVGNDSPAIMVMMPLVIGYCVNSTNCTFRQITASSLPLSANNKQDDTASAWATINRVPMSVSQSERQKRSLPWQPRHQATPLRA